ncbi:glycosyltransferase family 4 protein [uncultured Sphaerochaeta sp.]|uniref:glycosyltransferase family 4 protein n=1 Tax=uncultured Sphaerochaeta sp. TaxID=886478 RepID=UPI002A0A3FC5|nr:glycosyltransferase family 4 protein [uncultured Sphaerochaeta sp.]
MKILVISNLYPPYVLGGYEILCGQVVEYLKKRNHEVHILTSDHASHLSEGNIHRDLHLFQPFDQIAGYQRKDRIRAESYNSMITKRCIKEIKPEVIFIWSLLRLTPSAAREAENSRIPVVYTFNDENITSFLEHRFALSPKAFAHWFLDTFINPEITLKGLQFKNTTCISKVVKRNLLSKGVSIANSQVIYQGIPLEQFPPKSEASLHKPIKLLYAGQLHEYKGVHTLISALAILHSDKTVPPISLTIVGKGPPDYTKQLEEIVKKHQLNVEFKGLVPHEKMSSVYTDHDLFIFPSIWEEPFGLTHLEAMASGLPVISTANGGQGEFLLDGQNALTFLPGNEKTLADQIKRILQDPVLFTNLAKAGQATAISQFSFDRYIQELEALLAKAMQSRD